MDMRIIQSVLTAFVILMSGAAALACSMPVGAPVPACPAGQVFDTASACSCVDADKAPWIKPALDYEAAQAIATQPPADYTACAADADCIVAQGVCGATVAVNTSHLQSYRQASQRINSTSNCETVPDSTQPVQTASCQQRICTLK